MHYQPTDAAMQAVREHGLSEEQIMAAINIAHCAKSGGEWVEIAADDMGPVEGFGIDPWAWLVAVQSEWYDSPPEGWGFHCNVWRITDAGKAVIEPFIAVARARLN